MRNSKYVESYFCTLSPIGVYTLVFNLTERWLYYHQYNDEMYIFGPEEENETHEQWESRIQEVPKFLPKIEKGMYLHASSMDKDQLHVYFIPHYSEWVKNPDKMIIEPVKLIP